MLQKNVQCILWFEFLLREFCKFVQSSKINAIKVTLPFVKRVPDRQRKSKSVQMLPMFTQAIILLLDDSVNLPHLQLNLSTPNSIKPKSMRRKGWWKTSKTGFDLLSPAYTNLLPTKFQFPTCFPDLIEYSSVSTNLCTAKDAKLPKGGLLNIKIPGF